MTSRRSVSERLFALLLRLYPARFREQYAESMLEFQRDRLRAEQPRGAFAACGLWLRILADVLLTASAERLDALRDGLRAGRHRTIASHDLPRKEEAMNTLWQDVRYALRGMAQRPGFTAVILATLALGIGANAAIFSVVDGVLLRALPYAEADRVVSLQHESPYGSTSEPEFMDYRRELTAFQHLAAYSTVSVNLTGTELPERVRLARVSDGFFPSVGVGPRIGRVFAPDEERPHGPRVIVLSYGLWQRRFAGDTGIVGRSILLNATALTVIGVMPPAFDFPSASVSAWSPLRLDTDSLWTRNNHYLDVIGRLKPGATLAEAAAQARTLDARMSRDFTDTYFPGKPLTSKLLPIRDVVLGSTRPYLLALLGAVAFVLLIACGNVGNLLLARGEVRRKEFAIRTALGAAPDRIVRQVLTESALLAFAGGVLGLLVAWGGVKLLIALAPNNIPRLDQVHLDMRVLAFTALVSLLTGVVFGLVPALRATHTDSADTIRDGTRGGAHAGGVRNARRIMVISEVTLAVVMLVGAGLFVRSLRELQRSTLGFDATNVLTAELSMLPREYPEARAILYSQQVIEKMRALPGVEDAAVTGALPVTGDDSRWSIMVDGKVLKTIAEAPSPKPVQVSPEYFRAMRIPIVRGRGFQPTDRSDGAPVAIVSESMVKELWPGQDPIGRTIKMFSSEAPWATVVGVAGDVHSAGYGSAAPSTMYFPYAQAGKSAYYTPRVITVVVRTKGDPDALAPTVRRVVTEIDRSVPISRMESLEDILGTSIGSRRFSTGLLSGFAALALVLSSIGIYGVIAYGVSQRTYEIGLRMALGAQRSEVLRLVLGEALRMVAVGLTIGVAGGVAVARLVRSLLVGVGVFDPVTLVIVAAALVGAAVIAALIPARRAAAISPTEALRAG